MIMQDDRTPEQRETHRILIVGTDRCLSGWGQAEGGVSIAAWACSPEVNSDRVFNWVKSRADMLRVREVVDMPGSRYRPRGRGHCHIYVVNPGHPAASW